MSAPLATLARLLLRTSEAASESFDAAAARAFGLESVLNRCIRESSRAGELLEELDGRSLAIMVRGLGIRLYMQATKTRMKLSVGSVRSGIAAANTDSANATGANSATAPGMDKATAAGANSTDVAGADNATALGTDSATVAGRESADAPGTGNATAHSTDSADAPAADSSSSATATVEGTPPVLLRLLGNSGAAGFRESGAELSGDVATAESFAELLSHARPDLEDELSKLIGDLAAHEVAGAARRTDAWARQAGSALTMNASEFLQEEARQLPPRVEVNAFGRDVERLRDDVERAAQRLARLQAHRRRVSEDAGDQPFRGAAGRSAGDAKAGTPPERG